jgi:hypothetical protein
MKLTRKQFLEVSAALGGLSLPLGALAGCGDDDDGSGTGGTGGTGGSSGGTAGAAGTSGLTCSADVAVTVDHDHQLTVPPADVQAGADKTYTTSSVNAHTHMVTVTSVQFQTLAAGGSVTIESSTDAQHSHTVTVTCA